MQITSHASRLGVFTASALATPTVPKNKIPALSVANNSRRIKIDTSLDVWTIIIRHEQSKENR